MLPAVYWILSVEICGKELHSLTGGRGDRLGSIVADYGFLSSTDPPAIPSCCGGHSDTR